MKPTGEKYDDAFKRPDGIALYGWDVELFQKKEAKRGGPMEKEAQKWIEDVLGIQFEASLEEELKSGQILCNLINSIQPGSVKKIHKMNMPFMQMENISFFLDACKSIGMQEFELFNTVDLFEGKDIPQVVITIHALGRQAQKIGFKGPTLGARLSEKKETVFTEEQLAQARSAVPLQNSLGHDAPGNKLAPSIDLSREVVKHPSALAKK